MSWACPRNPSKKGRKKKKEMYEYNQSLVKYNTMEQRTKIWHRQKHFYILHWTLRLEQKCNNSLNTLWSRHHWKRNSRLECQGSIDPTAKRVADLYLASRTYILRKNQRQGWMEPTMDNIKSNQDSPRGNKCSRLLPRNSFQRMNRQRGNYTSLIKERIQQNNQVD